jgi:peptidyl-prolyl cis-trans isomerase B (cyclophilin B)
VPTAKQRREAERRRLQRQSQNRARRSARHRRYALITSIVGTVVVIAIVLAFVVAVTNDDSKKSTNTAGASSPAPSPSGTTTTTGAAAKYPCDWQQVSTTPAKKVAAPDTTRPPRTGTVNLLVQTTQGAMTFQLDRAAAPCAVESFVSLAEQQYFTNSPCHRLTSGGTLSVLQCGDPTGTGSGGPGYEFNDELTGKEKYTRGVIAMANAGPNTNGSQFFLVYKDSTLSPNYTIFGKVTSGLKVVDKVAAAGSDNANGTGDGKPKLAIKLTGISVVQ